MNKISQNTKGSSYGWALNVAIVGALVYSRAAISSWFTDVAMIRGYWALISFVAYPWFILLGALLYSQNADDSRRIRYAGIAAAVLSVAYILSGCIPLKDPHDFVNNDFTSIPVCVILPIAYLSIGAYYFAKKKDNQFTWQNAITTVAAFVVYLVCQYYLYGWTTRHLAFPLYVYALMKICSFVGMTVVSISIVDACRCDFAMKPISLKWVRIVLIVLCAYIWLRYSAIGHWRSNAAFSIFRLVNPLVCGIIAICVAGVKKYSRN